MTGDTGVPTKPQDISQWRRSSPVPQVFVNIPSPYVLTEVNSLSKRIWSERTETVTIINPDSLRHNTLSRQDT